MHLIGIFGLTINDQHILKEDENMSFIFEPALFEAANVGHNEAVLFLLKLRVDVDHWNKESTTAIMLACQKGHERVV